jgi:hypothetical protein
MSGRALLLPGNGKSGTGNGTSRQWPSVSSAPSFLRGCESIVGSCTRATWMPAFAGMTSGEVGASGGDGVQVRHGWSVALPERCPFSVPSFPRKRESIVGPCTRAPWMPASAGMTSGGVRASGGDGVQVRHGRSVALPETCPFSVPSFPRKRESIFRPCIRAPWMPAFASMMSGEVGTLGKDGMLPGTPRLSGNGKARAMRWQTLAPPRKPPARGLLPFPIPDSQFPATQP